MYKPIQAFMLLIKQYAPRKIQVRIQRHKVNPGVIEPVLKILVKKYRPNIRANFLGTYLGKK